MPQSLRQHLLDTLKGLPAAPRYWVAFSGGLDSTVLLHLMAGLHRELGAELYALHVDHGLSGNAEQWSAQCRVFAESLGVPLRVESVKVSDRKEKGLEAAARKARYRVFRQVLGDGEVLLCAHHRDDQVETLLLQLLRGGGVRGLAAMPPQRPLGRGVLVRPLLEMNRQSLRHYALEHELGWIDDPSNFDTSLERNYLRHTLLPQLTERRAGVREVLARSAGHFAESARLLDELAMMDRKQADAGGNRLCAATLKGLSPARCRNLLRFHVRQLGLSVPAHKHLQRILDEVLPAAADAEPLVGWPGAEVRRYRDWLYFMLPLAPLTDKSLRLPWDGVSALVLPQGLGRLTPLRCRGEGVDNALLVGRECEVRLRQGGERLRLPGRDGHHALKKLYQEAGVPPWERERRPLLYVDGALAQVAGLWTAAEYSVAAGKEGLRLQWQPLAIEKEEQNDDNHNA
ncbi:MAG: tRNA lysidine(34) synthetase TilS [Gammaproteobacteria bacterium]|nr:tRNA lysidine(34) synthetase TilS [Gammaproteobacteria bacterium]